MLDLERRQDALSDGIGKGHLVHDRSDTPVNGAVITPLMRVITFWGR
jgi:hypothetical protein